MTSRVAIAEQTESERAIIDVLNELVVAVNTLEIARNSKKQPNINDVYQHLMARKADAERVLDKYEL